MFQFNCEWDGPRTRVIVYDGVATTASSIKHVHNDATILFDAKFPDDLRVLEAALDAAYVAFKDACIDVARGL